MNTAIISGHVYINDYGRKDIEIFTQSDDDYEGTEIFDGVEFWLQDELLVTEDEKDYFFVAVVKAWFEYNPDAPWDSCGDDWDVAYEIWNIGSIEDLKTAIGGLL